MSNRYPEIDLLRTLAVLMMLAFHFVFNLEMFYEIDLNVFTGPWWYVGRICALMFLILVGVSFMISWDRTVKAHPEKTFWQIYLKYFRRGVFVIACGMLVTIVTYFNMGTDGYIRFGVLHLIGTGVLLLPFFARFKEQNIALAIVFYILGKWVRTQVLTTSLLLPLGFRYRGFSTIDYYPLLPWFGVILLGAALGHLLYVRYPGWRGTFPMLQRDFPILTWPGRYALWIYLIHQPIFLGILGMVLS